MSRERPSEEGLRPPDPGEPPLPVFEPPPAPVFTEDGLFGGPIPLEVYDRQVRERGPGLAWLLGFLAAIAVALWLATLSVAQATSEAPALAALERGVAALTEVDGLLDLHLEEVQGRADAGDRTLTLPSFPMRDAGVETAGVTGDGGAVDRERLREALLDRSARLVYMRGPDALRTAEVAPEPTPLLSTAGGVRALLSFLSADLHALASFWVWPLGGAALLLGALTLLAARGFGRFVALGVVMVVGAAPVLLAGLAVRVALGMAGIDTADALGREFDAIGRELSAVPVRNALWLAAAGLAIALPSAVAGAVFARSVRRG